MRNVLILGILVLSLFPVQDVFAATKPVVQPLEISGWVPYWRKATGTADVMPNIKTLKEVNPFGYTMKTDGTIFDAAKMDEEPWLSLRKSAKDNKVRYVPTIMWANGAAIHAVLSNGTTRRKLEDDIAALVNEKGYDGIDIDFEGKKAETKEYFSLFLKGLAMRMPKKWVMCTIEARTPLDSRYESTPPADATMYANDYVAINKYCDRVKIMAYDQGTIDLKLNRAAKGAPYIPVADPLWVEKSVALAAKTISKKKIMIGIATYGYEYTVTPLTESGYRYKLQWALNPQYGIDLAKQFQTTPSRNGANELSFTYIPTSTVPAVAGTYDPSLSNGEVPTTTTTSDTPQTVDNTYRPFNIVWWSDAKAIQDKIDVAKKLGVRGVSIFKLDGGQDPALWDVLKKI